MRSCTSSAACIRSASSRPPRASRARPWWSSSWARLASRPWRGRSRARRLIVSASRSQRPGSASASSWALQASRGEAASRRRRRLLPGSARASRKRCRPMAPALANTSPTLTSRLGRPRRCRASRRASASRCLPTSRQRSPGLRGRSLGLIAGRSASDSPAIAPGLLALSLMPLLLLAGLLSRSLSWRCRSWRHRPATWSASWSPSRGSSWRGCSPSASSSSPFSAQESTAGTSSWERGSPGAMRALRARTRAWEERRFWRRPWRPSARARARW